MHISLAVITDENSSVNDLLSVYGPASVCPSEYLEFYSETEDLKEEYENETREVVFLPYGTWILTDDDRCFVKSTKEECEKNNLKYKLKYDEISKKYTYYKWDISPIGGVVKSAAIKDLYPSFEDFAEEWHEYDWDDEAEEYGYYYNPMQKFDYWTIGGRYENLLQFFAIESGSSGKIKDIDFEKDENKVTKLQNIWEHVVNGEKFDPGCDVDPMLEMNCKIMSKNDFVDLYSSFATFAVILPDGLWREQPEFKKIEWIRNFKKEFIDTADPEWNITIVDVHF